MKPDLDELERLAKAATPGPWKLGHLFAGKPRVPLISSSERQTIGDIDLHNGHVGDCQYIAAANPATILALIADLRTKDRRLEAAVNYQLIYRAMLAAALASPAAPDAVGESKTIRDYRVALFMAAAHCQGGHSDAGAIIADLLGVPFPLRMEPLADRARKEGLDPDGLWPWWAKMRAERGEYRKAGEKNDGPTKSWRYGDPTNIRDDF